MSSNGEDSENTSLVGENEGSVVSTIADRHGFIGGSQYSPDLKPYVSPAKLLKREQKWLFMVSNWDKFMARNYKKVRERCRKGIPPSVRPKAWLYLCNGRLLMDQNPKLYSDLLSEEGDPRCVEDIKKDLHRQFPYHEMFVEQEGHGQRDLYDVLKAYSLLNPSIGYCQAQAPIAAFLLMHMPAEHAFWCLVSICEKYLKGYYSQGMETLQVDGEILFALLKKICYPVYKHLKKQKVDPILYMTEWFLCVFTRTLPWPTLLRVWDIFLCEGVKVVFKVAIVVIKVCLPQRSIRALKKKYPSMYETLEALRNPPQDVLEEEFLIKQILKLNVTEEEFEYEHQKQSHKYKNRQKELAKS